MLFRSCLRFCGSRSAAEDLLQEGFIRVFHDIRQYRGEGSLDGWVRRIFIRAGIAHFHSLQKQPEIVELDQLEYLMTQESGELDPQDPESALALLQKLPPGFRAVLNLAVLEEKSHEEIARALDITVGTSRSQLARAKAFLRKILQKTLVFA